MDLAKPVELMSPLEYSIAMAIEPELRKSLTPEACDAFKAQEEIDKLREAELGDIEDNSRVAANEIAKIMGFGSFSKSSSKKRTLEEDVI